MKKTDVALAVAAGILGAVLLCVCAAHAAPAPAPGEHLVKLTDGQMQLIEYIFAEHAGRGCSINEASAPGAEPSGLIACREALAAHDLLVTLQAEIAADKGAKK